jgi:zona occludens toxin (predicted ATPase)
MSTFAKRVAVGMAKIVLALALLVAGMFSFVWYKALPMESFCKSVPDSATPEMVVASAKEQGFPVFDVVEARGVVSVLSQHAPWFRYSCEVEFTNGQVIGKRVIAAD